MIKSTFWRAFALTATLILTGCSHSQPEQEGRPQAWLQPGTRITLPAPVDFTRSQFAATVDRQLQRQNPVAVSDA